MEDHEKVIALWRALALCPTPAEGGACLISWRDSRISVDPSDLATAPAELRDLTRAALTNNPEPLELRPHHFLCTLTYSGAGYTEEFVDNLNNVIARLNRGPVWVEVVDRPDAICQPMLPIPDHPSFHCYNESVIERDRRALSDANAALEQFVDADGNRRLPHLRTGVCFWMVEDMTRHLRGRFVSGEIRNGCVDCEWNPRCTDRAAGGYIGSRLHPVSNEQ